MKKIIILIFTSAILTGCANPINRNTAVNYYEYGERALQRGNLPAAKEMFSRALINARLGGMKPSDEAQIQLKLGRVHGNLCLHDEAEKLFSEAISNIKKDSNDIRASYPAKIEQAQYLFDIGHYKKAANHLEIVIAEGKKLFGDKDPLSIAVLLDDLSVAYEEAGEHKKSVEKRNESEEIKNNNKGAEPVIIKSKENYTPYPKTC